LWVALLFRILLGQIGRQHVVDLVEEAAELLGAMLLGA
jgi:hypothetical protein